MTVLALTLLAAACAAAEPLIVISAETCSSTLRSDQPSGPVPFSIENDHDRQAAVVMGTYREGSSHEDLAEYGRDVTTRPAFIDALEIYEVAQGETREIVFDHGPGTFFVACMTDTNSMVVLDDLVVATG